MLDSRGLHRGGTQPLPSVVYTSKIIIKRRVVKTGHVAGDGDLGTTVYEFKEIAKGIPASITSKQTDLPVLQTGQTERGDMMMVIPYRRLSDNSLLVQTRDIIVDMTTGDQYQVKWAYDPMNIRQHIHAALTFGVTNEDLAEQD